MGSKEDYGPKLLCVVNHFLHLPFPFCQRQETSAQGQALDERSLPTSKTETDTTVCQHGVLDETLGTMVDMAFYNPEYQMAGSTKQRELWCQLSPSHVVVVATFAK